MRVVVIGGPRTGKTTYATKLAKQLGAHLASTGKRTEHEGGLVSTDNYMHKANWAELPDRVIADLKDRDSYVLEGTQAARVLRRWLVRDPESVKVDKVLVFGRPWVPRTPGQESMAKAVRTIFRDLQPLLQKAGIEIEHMTPPEMTSDEWAIHKREAFAEAEKAEPEETKSIDLEPEGAQDTPQSPGS